MSNASAPLSSLADSLDSLRQRMSPIDQRKHRVLAAELIARSLAMSLVDDVSLQTVNEIRILADRVSVVNPDDTAEFDAVLDAVEALLGALA
jgi:hypothetical protein